MLDSWQCVAFTLTLHTSASRLTRCVCSVTPLTTAGWVVYYYLIAAVGSHQGLRWMVPAVSLLSLFFSFLTVFCALTLSDLLHMQWHHGGGEAPSLVSTLLLSQQTRSLILWRCHQHTTVQMNKGRKFCTVSFCKFYFAKTGIDVSDKMVHIQPNCSPVDSVIGRYTLCISC